MRLAGRPGPGRRRGRGGRVSRGPSAAACLGALLRLARAQSRAVRLGKIASLDRALRVKRLYLGLLDEALAAERASAGALRGEFGLYLAEERRCGRQAAGKLEEICGELEALKNRGKLLRAYLG